MAGYTAMSRIDRALPRFRPAHASSLPFDTRIPPTADPVGPMDPPETGCPAVQDLTGAGFAADLIDLLADICGTVPGLAAYLARHPEVLDGVLAGHFFAPWPGAAGLREAFDALAPGYRKNHVVQVEGAKTEATRTGRVQKVLDSLRG